MSALDELLFEFNVSASLDGFYEVYRFHRQNYMVPIQTVSSVVAAVAVVLAALTIYIIVGQSYTMMTKYKVLLVAQILVSCAICLFIQSCGLYSIVPHPVVFSKYRGLWGSNGSIVVTLVLVHLVVLQMEICSFTVLRNALISSRYQIGSLSNETTVLVAEASACVFFILVLVCNFPLFVYGFVWDQEELIFNAAENFDPRLRDFLLSQAPYFFIFHRITIYQCIEIVTIVSFGFSVLFYMVYLTASSKHVVSGAFRKLQKKILYIELITIAAFVITVIFPVFGSFIFIILGSEILAWLPMVAIFWVPGQSLSIIMCITYLSLITPYKVAFLRIMRFEKYNKSSRLSNSQIIPRPTVL